MLKFGNILICVFTLFGFFSSVYAQSYVNDQGQLIVDGEPYFVMGFFSDSYASGYDEKMATIDSLSGAGFNTAKTSVMGDTVQTDAHLSHAGNSGMKLIYDGAQNNEWKEFHLNMMRTFNNNPSLLGWYIADDSHGIHPDTLKMLYDRAKGIDSLHITTHSMALSCWNDYDKNFIRERIDYCDVLQMQSYPIGKEPIDEVYHDMRRTIEAAEPYNTPVVVDLQLFSWQLTGHDWGRWPTPTEAELMTWLAIVAGVDGYLYYTFYDRLADPPQSLANSQPTLWRTVKETAAMVNEIKPDLLCHNKFITFSPQSHCYYGQWITDDYSTVIAINTSTDDSLSFVIPTAKEHTEPQILFESRPGNFSLEDRLLKVKLGPMSAQFYRLYPPNTGILPHTSTDAAPHLFNLMVYPNPANNRLQLSINTGTSGRLHIKIYSIRGHLVESREIYLSAPGSHKLTIPVNHLAAGMYIIHGRIGDKMLTKKWTYLP